MQLNRRPPSKRYSSYVPPTEISTLVDQVSSMSCKGEETRKKDGVNMRTSSVSSVEKTQRRKSLNTLHFDALQNAVSKLSRIDDFDLEELGYGFFSDVFKVTHKQSGKVMVLKRNKNTNTKLNILREVQLMNRLAHPNILKFMGVCVHEGQLHALTEFINGGDLDQLVQHNTPLSWTDRVGIALDISNGLSYLHSLGIFHRDMTAKNCLVRVTTDPAQRKKYSAVLADLGLAEKIPTKPEDQKRLRIVGTPYYMAPEVLHEKPYDERSDFFSFGLIICQLIIRTSADPDKLPRSNDFGLQKDLFSILVQQKAGAPSGFLQLAYDCCEVNPDNRPGVKEIVRRLEQTLNEEKMKQDRLLMNAKEISQPSRFMQDSESVASKSSLVTNYVEGDEISVKTLVASPSVRRPHGVKGRLSRSSSDVTEEFISHAASMFALSQKVALGDSDELSSVLSSLNPFRTLEKSELREIKLVDVPSSEVLEMTFDLPTPKSSTGSPPVSRRKRLQNLRQRSGCTRPRSLMLDLGTRDHLVAPQSPRAMTPDPYPQGKTQSLAEGATGDIVSTLPASCPQSPISDIEFNEAQNLPTFQQRLKRALVRSVALSPQGKRLLSWWHTHGRNSDWRSLTSLLSVMTDKMGTMKKSISVPDLARFRGSLSVLAHNAPVSNSSSRSSVSSDKASPRSSTSGKPPSGSKFYPHLYPAYVTLPRKKKSRCQASDACRKRRSKTSDDVFPDPILLEILHEEATDVKQAITWQQPAPHILPQPSLLMNEINNNVKTLNLKVPPGNLPDADSPHLGESESSSSSSGTSSVGLQMTLQTGVISSNRRRRIGFQDKIPPPQESNQTASKDSFFDPQADDGLGQIHPDADEHHDTPRSNRDSGFNDDYYSTDHSCDSQSSRDAPNPGAGPHPAPCSKSVSFSIPPYAPRDSTPSPGIGLPGYFDEVAPRCKVNDLSDSKITLLGKTH